MVHNRDEREPRPLLHAQLRLSLLCCVISVTTQILHQSWWIFAKEMRSVCNTLHAPISSHGFPAHGHGLEGQIAGDVTISPFNCSDLLWRDNGACFAKLAVDFAVVFVDVKAQCCHFLEIGGKTRQYCHLNQFCSIFSAYQFYNRDFKVYPTSITYLNVNRCSKLEGYIAMVITSHNSNAQNFGWVDFFTLQLA
jgi:hypothetical protein